MNHHLSVKKKCCGISSPYKINGKWLFCSKGCWKYHHLHCSQIQADHFQDKYFLLNCFHFPSEVTTLPPQEASHAGNTTPSSQPRRSYLAALARVPSLTHSESRYGFSLSHSQRCEGPSPGLQTVKSPHELKGNHFISGCCLNSKY